MALPAGYDERQYMPTERDFADVFAAKQNGAYYNLTYEPLGKDEPYYYPTIRIYLAAILLKWEELGKLIEHMLLQGGYKYVNGVKTLVPYYTNYDLAAIRYLAAKYKQFYIDSYKKYRDVGQGLESPEKRRQAARDARKGEINVNIKGNGNMLHLVAYSMKYGDADPSKRQTGGRMHLFFGKDLGGKYSIVVRGSNTYNSGKDPLKDAPYFKTEQEARDFVANADHNHIDTRVTIEDWRYVISDRRIEYGYKEIGRRIGPNGMDLGPEWAKDYVDVKPSDVVKVDTTCGPAYMLKSCELLKGK